MTNKKLRIVFTGGGSGGHIFPLIAVARELYRLAPGQALQLFYMGPNDASYISLLTQENLTIKTIISGKHRNYFSLQNIWDLGFALPAGFIQAFFKLVFIRPQLIFSKGGTGSLPVTFAARILRIPVFIHESDMVPGKSNNITLAWAKKIFTAFEKTEHMDLTKTTVVGNPLRKELLEGSMQGAKETLGITFTKPVMMFYGGSQGAQTINEFVMEIINMALVNYEIIHVCGKKNEREMKIESSGLVKKELAPYYHLYGQLDEVALKNAYAAADIIIARAGSGGIFEISALGKPSILIPLPSAAHDHQSKNAYAYAKTGASIIIEEGNLTPNFFLAEVAHCLALKEKMSQQALAFAKPLAAKAIAREILEFLHV